MPRTIEHDGRLLALESHNVPLQSREGQRWLRERHQEVMKHLNGYPAIREHLFTDKWAKKFLDEWLTKEGTVAQFHHPSFYLEEREFKMGFWPEDYLARADAALAFLFQKAPRANFRDLLGNLLKSNSAAAEFEVILAWAFSTHFGKDAVEPYPRISSDSKQNVDFAVRAGNSKVFIEAMILMDSPIDAAEKQNMIDHGTRCTIGSRIDADDAHRLVRACYEKVHQRDPKEPLILCVNQWATWPDPALGTEAVGRLLASEIWARDSQLIGVAYFYLGRLVFTGFAEARARATGAKDVLISEIRSALCRLAN